MTTRVPGTLTAAEIELLAEVLPVSELHLASTIVAIREVCPQLDVAKFPWLTVEENMSVTADRVAELLESLKVKVEAVRWPDRLRGVAAWTSGEPYGQPPREALLKAYERGRIALLKHAERVAVLPPTGRA